MKILKNNINNIITDLKNLAKSRTASITNEIDSKVKNIINEVILKGDEALVAFEKTSGFNKHTKETINYFLKRFLRYGI